jgi:hypothetical protein
MAILVSNPSTVQFTGAPAEPQDLTAITLEAGFTEELANAMQPPGQQSESTLALQKLAVSAAEAKLNNLQILPADVLLNAVGEANFAFSVQGSQITLPTESPKPIAETGEQLVVLEVLDANQAAELAAAALAAQMVSQLPVAPTNSQPAQTSNTLDAVGNIDPSMHLGGVELGQANKLDMTTPASTQASVVETTADANLQVANTLNDAVFTQATVSSLGKQEIQTDMAFLGVSKPIQALTPEASSVALTTGQTPKTTSEALLPNVPALQQSQPIDPLNQTAINAVGAEQKNLENKALEATSTAPSSIQTGITSTLNSVSVISDGVGRAAVTDNVTQVANQQQSVFDLNKSDVARPGDEGSANPVLAGGVAQNDEGVKTIAQAMAGIQSTDTSELNSDGILELKMVQAGGVLSDSLEQSVKSKVDNSAEESAFKFDAKLGAQVPNLAATVGFDNASQPTKPASLGGMALDQSKPASLAAPVVPVSIAAPVEQSQVLVTTEAVVVSQTHSAANGQEVIVETAVQTTTVTTIAKSSLAPGADETLATTADVQAVNTRAPVQVVKQTEYQFENRVEEDLATDDSLDLSVASAPSKSSIRSNQFELPQKTQLKDDTQTIASNSLSQAVNGPVLNNSSILDNEPSSEVNQVLTSNLISQNTAVQYSRDAIVQNETVQSVSRGFEEVSSTFVNSLVGGPQRPITTVMDWVALKPQEPPRPVMPHELRLDAGAVQVEIQRMVKEGGGHVVMELTPPDQSKFTIELKLDDNGGAYLRVEGVSDSTKTRLEQSAPQLQEQFQQMGLNLQLDMRQNRDSSSSGSANWMPNEPGFDNNLPQEATAQTNRAVAAERAHNQNGGQVYLYA